MTDYDQNSSSNTKNNNSEELSDEELDLVEQTFDLLKNLNSNIQDVASKKDKLEKDIQRISQTVQNAC